MDVRTLEGAGESGNIRKTVSEEVQQVVAATIINTTISTTNTIFIVILKFRKLCSNILVNNRNIYLRLSSTFILRWFTGIQEERYSLMSSSCEFFHVTFDSSTISFPSQWHKVIFVAILAIENSQFIL